MRVIQARSSGRKPEFFWLLFQFLRSISLCAMFQSPQMTTSRPSALQFLQVRQEDFHEAELGQLALRRGGTGRAVDRDHGQVADVGTGVAALVVELDAAEAGLDGIGLDAAIHAGAGITLLFGVVEMAVVAVRREEFLGHVAELAFQFLDADEIGVLLGHPVEETLLVGGADAVQVGGDNSWHGSLNEAENISGRRGARDRTIV
jgi:hypothetical protein